MPELGKPNNPKEIDVFNRYDRFSKLKVILISLAIALVMIVVVFFLVKAFSEYTITYVTFGGTVYGEELQPDTYKFLQRTVEPENLKKEGYYIAGYYKNAKMTQKFTFGKRVWNSATVYVDWQPGYAVQLFFVEGEDDNDRKPAEKTGIDLNYLKMYHEQYVKPGTTYELPLVYNEIEGNKHKGEQLLWYDNPDAIGDPIDTATFEMTDNHPLYGVWYDTSPSKFNVSEDGTLIRYLGNCYNIQLPQSVKRLKSIVPSQFISGLWDTTTVADGSNYSVFDKVVTDLKRIYINPECEEINSCAFRGCVELEKVVFLGNKITSIGEWAFAQCESLDTIQLPSSVTTLEKRAFHSAGIKTITGIENVTTINEGAFLDCVGLVELDLPKVTVAKQLAFAGCGSLRNLYLRHTAVVETNVTARENNVLYGSIQDTTIYVPAELLSQYHSTFPWEVYSSKIVAITE